ncbi:MAG: hypothetical protein JXM70_21130 [Pirellulales bacterium]|nr:hypothetical protein [Pirellulales bacterium]
MKLKQYDISRFKHVRDRILVLRDNQWVQFMGDISVEQSDKDNRSARIFRSSAGCLLFLLGACVLAWVLIVYGRAPLLASGILAATIGWLFYRWADFNHFGVLLWCLATVVSYAAIENQTSINEGDMVLQVANIVGMLSYMAAAIAFLVAAVRCRARRGRNLAGLALVLFSHVFWCLEASEIHRHIAFQEEIQETTRTLIDLHRLGNEVESFRVQFGRLPHDEEELVRFRRKPMPFHWDKYRYSYYLTDNNHYNLSCSVNSPWGRNWDLWGYILHYYGPTSTRRIHAELF